MTWLIAVKLFFSSAWRFLGTPVGVWAMRIAICVALLVCGELHGFYRGVKSERESEAKRLASAVRVVKKVEAKAEAITTTTDEQVAKREVEIRTVTKTLVERIPVYVSVETERSLVLPAGLIRLHNQAASGLPEVPPDPGFLPDAPSGVTASAFGETIVRNYGTAYSWKEAALACRSWVSEQADNFNSSISTARP